jgi:hypothetical protein
VLVTKTFVELLMCNARFHRRIEISTGDLGSMASTREFAQAIVGRLKGTVV